ncbi:MAG: c-type cytochrome [candidate division NC10 bacterium]|nr:c-type cytochrome [candidate division NC10 bacterium]MDE2320637.1 c-type cytochrome [candidate division NC10 bacterium]
MKPQYGHLGLNRVAVVVILLSFILIGEAAGRVPVSSGLPENPLAGAVVFEQKGCGRCHAIWGSGGTLGPDLATVDQGWSVVEFAGVLWNHSPKMMEAMKEMKISRPQLTPEEMEALTAYLYYLNFFDRPGDASRGERLISSKRCIECHALGGRGGKIGPALDKYGHYMSPIFLATAMWNHGPKIAEKLREHRMAMPQLFGSDIADLLAYINRAANGEAWRATSMVTGSPRRGAELFREKRCVACHAVRGEGDHVGPDLAQKRLPKKASAVAAIMWNHGPQMWAKMAEHDIPIPIFADNEMADIIAYLSFLGYSDEPGDPTRGRKVLRQKGCVRCHSIRGEGGGEGPDLARSKGLNSSIGLVTAIWNHAPNMEAEFKKRGIAWPDFRSTEMADLVAYLQRMRSQPPKEKRVGGG